MASRQSIEAGRGHVTLGLSDAPLRAGLAAAQAKFQAWGKGIMALGASIASTGFALAAPLALGLKAFIPYEQALADLRAVANPSDDVFARLKTRIEEVALASGTMPADVANGFTELLRAGVSADQILGGMGETLMQLSRVGQMSMNELAVVFSDIVNLFRRDGLSTTQVADLISRSADSSSISIRSIADSMSSGGASLAGFNQSLEDTVIAIGILGNAAIKGESAGTTLRTFFQRLAGVSADGTTDAADAVRELGLVVRDEQGNFLRLPQIMQNLQTSMSRFSQADQDRLRVQLGGARGERGIAALMAAGTSGWDRFRQDMMRNLPVAEKFDIMMNTLGSQLKRFWVSVTMVAIAIGEALAPKLRFLLDIGTPIVGAIRSWLQANAELIRQFDTLLNWVIGIGAGIFTFGALVYGISIPIKIASVAIGVLWWGLSTLAGGFGLVSFLAGAWGVAVSVASYLASIAVGVLTSGFGLLTLAGYAYAVGSAVWSALTWAATTAFGFATGASGSYTLALIAVWIWENIASLGATLLITALGVLVIAAGAVVIAFGGFFIIAGAVAAISAAAIALGSHMEPLIQSLGIFDGLGDAIANSPLAGFFTYLGELWTWLRDQGDAMYAAIVQFFNTTGLSTFLGIILKIALGWVVIAGVIVALIGYLSYLMFSSEQLSRVFAVLWEFAKRAWLQFKNIISGAIFLMKLGASDLIALGGQVLSSLSTIAGAIGQALATSMNEAVAFFSQAFSNIFNAGSIAFGGIVDIGTQAWGQLYTAIRGGNWTMAFEVIKAAGAGMWAELKFFGLTVFNQITDALVDTWGVIMREFKAAWVITWAEIKAIGLEGLATTQAAVGMNDAANANRREANRIRVLARGQAEQIRAGLDGTQEDIDRRRAAREAQDRARADRDRALFEGRAADVVAANQRLNELQVGQGAQAMLLAGAMFLGGEPIAGPAGGFRPPPFPGDRDREEKTKFSVMGTFSRDVAAGFLGAMTGTGESRAERLQREQRDLQRELVQLNRDMARRRGLVMA